MQIKTFYIKTFGCQMNYADSEKIHMILMSAGLRKVIDPVKADIVIMNTCSVRQKGEDRVFGFMREIARYHKQVAGWMLQVECSEANQRTSIPAYQPLFGITGCMVRKSGMASRYAKLEMESWRLKTWIQNEHFKRNAAKKITLLEASDSLQNYDDELFLRSPLIDFTFRIEEVSLVTKILSLISWEDIGNDAKFNEYLAVKQLQENPASANVIIQTGCDNYCTFCIVPFTRGRELSRPQDEIVAEITEVVAIGTKEVTLLGQNVNSYGKETKAKLWNSEEMKWVSENSPHWVVLTKGDGLESTEFPSLRGAEERGGVEVPLRKYEKEILDWPSWWQHSLFPYWNLPKNNDLTENAKKLKKAGILSEVKFWQSFKNNKQFTFDIDRQVIIGNYIVDFLIPEVGLVFEIDGSSHEEKGEYDKERGWFLSSLGLQVAHFSWYDVLHNLDWVYEQVVHLYEQRAMELSGTFHPALRAPLKEGNDGPFASPLGNASPGIDMALRGEWTHQTFLTPFRELLEKINTVGWLDRIRFTSSNPHDMTKDILDAHFDLPKLCPYLHFALQSGSDSMLKRMNRKHTYADFKVQLDYLRSRDPFFSISTDIIVGFPGETEEEFQATATAMRECQFDFAFIARYNPRSGTVASSKYEDDITPEEKARRWTILNDILRETVTSRNLLMVGREEEILISGEWKDETWVGRTRNWKEVFIQKWIEDSAQCTEIKIGDLVKVRIMESDGWVLKGVRI